jgi:hypothetical protein
MTQRDDVFRSIADYKRQAKDKTNLIDGAGGGKQLSL